MENKDKVIQTIRMNGPVIPAQIAKVLNTDIMMASAVLSEFVSSKILRISHLKFGSTPLYYLPGQESKLQNFSKHLHEKERDAYDILMQKKIVRDKEAEPVVRVALRNIRDFAIPLKVKLKDNEEIFWKWYLTTNQEAESIIKGMISLDIPVENKKEEPAHERQEEETEKKPEQEEKPESAKEKEEERLVEKETKERKYEGQSKKENFYHEKKEEDKSKFVDKTAQDRFLNEIKRFLEKNSIGLVESKITKKNSEVDLILELPSSVGTLNYYCMAKNKKRITDADLSSAFVQGQLKKLPVLFIMKGELTKKAREMLSKEFKGMKIKKI